MSIIRVKYISVFSLTLLFLGSITLAQNTPAEYYKIRLLNDSIVITEHAYVVKGFNPSIYYLISGSYNALSPDSTKSILHFKGVRRHYLWFQNPYSSKYFFSNGAYPLKPGQTTLSNYYVLLNYGETGITKNISIAGGLFPLPIQLYYYIAPKLKFKMLDQLYIGGSVSYLSFLNEIQLYGGKATVTYGNSESNISLGYARYWESEFTQDIFIVSGQLRVFKNVSLITDTGFFPISVFAIPVYSAGVRVFSPRFSVEAGVISPGLRQFTDEIFILPFLGVNYVIEGYN